MKNEERRTLTTITSDFEHKPVILKNYETN